MYMLAKLKRYIIEGTRIRALKVSYWHGPSPVSHRNFQHGNSYPYEDRNFKRTFQVWTNQIRLTLLWTSYA